MKIKHFKIGNRKGVFILLSKFLLLSLIISTFIVVGMGCTSKEDDQSVAVVNGVEIERAEFDIRLDQIKASYTQQGFDFNSEEGKMFLTQIEEFVLTSLIDEEVLMQEIEKKGVSISEQEVDDEIAMIKAQFGDDDTFNEILKENGLTEDELRELLVDEIKRQQYIEDEVGDIVVTEEEMEEFYTVYSQQIEEPPAYEEIKDMIEQQIQSDKMQEEEQLLIEQLKSDSEINILW